MGDLLLLHSALHGAALAASAVVLMAYGKPERVPSPFPKPPADASPARLAALHAPASPTTQWAAARLFLALHRRGLLILLLILPVGHLFALDDVKRPMMAMIGVLLISGTAMHALLALAEGWRQGTWPLAWLGWSMVGVALHGALLLAAADVRTAMLAVGLDALALGALAVLCGPLFLGGELRAQVDAYKAYLTGDGNSLSHMIPDSPQTRALYDKHRENARALGLEDRWRARFASLLSDV